MARPFKDITGLRSGQLVAIRVSEQRADYSRARLWECQCDCGRICAVLGHLLKIRRRTTCGFCKPRTKHGLSNKRGSNAPEFFAYNNAKNRCNRLEDKSYANYGGRGIEFRFTSLQQMVDEIGLRPSPEYTLDRIDNDGHYEPGNVRWATRYEQAANRQDTSRFYHAQAA